MRFLHLTLILASLLLVGFLSSCQKRSFPRPTKQFYVNDYAHAFSSSLEAFIIRENESLYDEINDDGIKLGAQVVFTTFVVNSIEEEAELRGMGAIDLFNEWRIGKNDLGVLVIFLFTEVEEENITSLNLTGLPVVITGYQADQYLVPAEIDDILAYTMENSGDFEINVMCLLCEILREIYEGAYNINYSYDLETLEEIYYSYTGPMYDNSVAMNLVLYLFSSHSTLIEKILGLIPFALTFFIAGGLVINKGGGGGSGGTGFFRRRR